MRSTTMLVALALVAGRVHAQPAPPLRALANGVELAYVERGQGDPVILIHGGSGDYRAWEPQLSVLSSSYRVIAYSQRYHYPNQNASVAKNYSPYLEADDLAALMHVLAIERAHLVGNSYGAYIALVLALEHPALVRSLVLAEPPVHQLIRDTPDGEAAYQQFMTTVMQPAATAFEKGDDEQAMKILSDGISGPQRWANLSAPAHAAAMQNARAFRVLTLSADPFPALSKDRLRQMRIPTLIITGENTTRIHRLVTDELARLLPNAESVTIPNAGHGSSRDNPVAYNSAVAAFFARHR